MDKMSAPSLVKRLDPPPPEITAAQTHNQTANVVQPARQAVREYEPDAGKTGPLCRAQTYCRRSSVPDVRVTS
jgi:hypothetical protein